MAAGRQIAADAERNLDLDAAHATRPDTSPALGDSHERHGRKDRAHVGRGRSHLPSTDVPEGESYLILHRVGLFQSVGLQFGRKIGNGLEGASRLEQHFGSARHTVVLDGR